MGDQKSAQVFGVTSTGTGNNFGRPDGQNVGNFLGARPSSRVLAAPGGSSNFAFGNEAPTHLAASQAHARNAEELASQNPPAVEVPQQGGQEDKKASFLSAMTAKLAGNAGASPKGPASKVVPQQQQMASPPRPQQVRCLAPNRCPIQVVPDRCDATARVLVPSRTQHAANC